MSEYTIAAVMAGGLAVAAAYLMKGRQKEAVHSAGTRISRATLDPLLQLQEKEDPKLGRRLTPPAPDLLQWANHVQERFRETLSEKENFLADKGELPYPEAEIRLALKVQGVRCLLSKRADLLTPVESALGHLACFQTLNPLDRDALAIVEGYREEMQRYQFAPDAEDETIEEGGPVLRDVVREYGKALPTFHTYQDRVKEEEKRFQEEFKSFIETCTRQMKR